MKRVLTAVVLIPIVLLIVFKAPLWLFAAVTGLFAVIAAHEYLNIARVYEPNVLVDVGVAVSAFFFVSLSISLWTNHTILLRALAMAIAVIVLFYPFFLLGWSMRLTDFRNSLPAAVLGYFIVPYVIFPFSALVGIRSVQDGWFFVLWLFFMVWSGDIFAYYVGKNFGKRLIAPRISPKKTVEGTVASLVGSAAVSVLICYFVPSIERFLGSVGLLQSDSVFGQAASLHAPPMWVPIVLALAINVAAQLGDLAESMIKRGAGVKDSGNILPGHGGMLDRVDALLFAAPVGMLLFQLTKSYFYQR